MKRIPGQVSEAAKAQARAIAATQANNQAAKERERAASQAAIAQNQHRTLGRQRRYQRAPRFVPLPLPEVFVPRPDPALLTSLLQSPTRLPFPAGAFNAGLIAFDDRYICVYRSSEVEFTGCVLDKDLDIEPGSYRFQLSNCADPRLVWTPDNRLLVIYSSVDEGMSHEFIAASILMDRNESDRFIDTLPIRLSPKGSGGRQKNWMPFICDGAVYVIASVCPHVVYRLKTTADASFELGQRYETNFSPPWFNRHQLRGNTTAIALDDGTYLGTFHTAMFQPPLLPMHRRSVFYDNGCYVFEGQPPFKVLRCANRTYLPAESAVEPPFRKAGEIQVNFPVGAVREGDEILISYGDNDSCVKIMRTTVAALLDTTLEVV